MNFFVQSHEYPAYLAYLKAWRERRLKWEYVLEGTIKKEWDDFIFSETELSVMPDFVIAGMRLHERVYLNASFNNFGNLTLATLEPLSDEHADILLRFAKVFDLTYTRFNDLKHAEAQTREAQIQLAMERVRARTMAMQRSEELAEAASLLFQQVKSLGIESFSSGYTVWTNNNKDLVSWMCNADGSMNPPFVMPVQGEANHVRMYESWKAGEALYVEDMSGETMQQHYRYLRSFPLLDKAFEKSLAAGFALPVRQVHNVANFSWGNLLFITYAPCPEYHEIFNRFAKVFEQTYTRFLDLQKAEVQAREARIEAALERVRAKAMAMRSSNDLMAAISAIFVELRNLGIKPLQSGLGLLERGSCKAAFYSATDIVDGNNLELIGWVLLQDHPVLADIYDHWLRKEHSYFPVLQGDMLQSYYEKLRPGLQTPNPHTGYQQYGQFYYFEDGALYAWTEKPVEPAEIPLFKRFTSVLALTYKRYKELQQSEANARQAVRQAALDRVRAEIASMRSVDDLQRIIPIIWQELLILGVPFFRCGVFIMDADNQLIHAYLSTPEGKSLAVLHLPFGSSDTTRNAVAHWLEQKVYIDHWDKQQFIAWTQSMIGQGQIEVGQHYQATTEPPESLTLQFVPFTQGMLYAGSTDLLSENNLNLVQALADAFSVAYARYEDFKKLEEAKNRIEVTLTKLKATQAQLVQSEKMASLGELTAGIAHEIQNPLNFVNNFSEVSSELIEEMQEELADGNTQEALAISEDIRQNLEKIHYHGKRADSIVKGMLQHSRSTSGEKQLTDINALADEYLRLACHGLRTKEKDFNAHFKLEADPAVGKIEVVPQEIGRVMLNLFNNAFYATRQKKAQLNGQYQPQVIITTKRVANTVEIRVKDNGTGIPESVRNKIFQPFFTTKPTGEGTGLGLSLSYDIVKAHGGELNVESKEGAGAEFIIRLPVHS